MKVCALVLAAASILPASGHRPTPAALRAQSDFERVQMAPRPSIPAAQACIQSQAAALAVSLPSEQSLLYYRKGYCAFAGAAATADPRQFLDAAGAFDRAIAAWPARSPDRARHAVPQAVPAALSAFAAIARLHAATTAAAIDAASPEVAAALASPSGNFYLMPDAFSDELLSAASQWLGWSALLANQLDEAARLFAGPPDSGWAAWVQGRRDFASARYAAAAAQYAAAIDRWQRIWEAPGPTLAQALPPRPQMPPALADWGAARLLAGDLPGAILTLDASIQADSANPHAFFLRARAKELAGRTPEALADYNLASRAAFAAARDLASGEAHLYRGILLYRRQDFARAEDEFSSALNFQMTVALRPDAGAWRHLAAVAGGSCGAARQSLDLALAVVSPFFPQAEARSLAAACGGS